jgi:preprotein translocase subunit SecF
MLIGVNFLSVIGGINTNLEFTSGREMVFRISDKLNEDAAFEDSVAVTSIANSMIDRLENALVTKYEVFVEGNDQIRVTVSETSDTKYTRLQNYLGFDAEFTLCTTTEVCATNEQMFNGQTARIEYKGQNPFVVFSVEDLTYLKEVLITEAGGEESTDGELLLWAGKLEEDSYSESLNNPDIAEKILLRFPVNNLWWDTETKTELAYLVSPSQFGQPNENNIFASTVVAQANEEAIYFRNLFNAGDLAYSVEFLYAQNVPAAVEALLSLDNILSLANSQTLWAMVASMIMMVIVLAIVYRLGAIGIITTTTLSIFATLFTFIALNLEFSSGALIGFLIVGVLGIFTSVMYLTYTRREIYQGRTFKKAHSEANGQLLPFMIDVTVIGLVFGLFLYIFGGNLAQSLAVILMIGSVINAIVVYFGNQILFGQLFQATIISKKLSWLNLKASLIPDVLKNEKPVYVGRFATRDFASKGPLLSPIAMIGGLVTLIAMVSLSALNLPAIASPNQTSNARLYLEAKEFSQFESTADLQVLIDHLFINGESLVLSEDTIQVHDLTRREDDITVEYRIFVAELAIETLDGVTFSFNNGVDPILEGDNFNDLLEEVITLVYEDDQVTMVGFYPGETLTNQPTVMDMTLGALLAMTLVTVYLLIRHGIAKALTTTLISAALGLLTLGIFVATRIPSPSTITLSIVVIGYVSMMSILSIFMRAKELQGNQKDRPSSIDDFTLSLKKGSSQLAAPIFLTVLALVYPGLTYLALGPGALQALFAAILLGSAMVALFTTAIIPAVFKPIYRLLGGLNQALSFDWLPKRKTKTKTEETTRSTEPQEATYIGIND